MKKLRWSLLVMVLVLSSVLQACGSGDTGDSQGNGEKVKIKWATWGNPGELTRHQEFTKDFNARHPDIEAELIPIPGEYDQKILTQLTGGTAPDLFYAGDAFIVKLIENKSIEEITPRMNAADRSLGCPK